MADNLEVLDAPKDGIGIGDPPPDAKSGLSGPPADPKPDPQPDPKAGGADDKSKIEPKAGEPPPKGASTIPPKTTTIADDKSQPPVKQPITADWPEDWRTRLAGDNKALAKRLERMQSPKDVLTSWLSIEQRMSSGELKKMLPTRHTDEELAEFRKANGIPDEAKDYDVNLGNGVVWGEADKPLIESYTKYAHENNIPADEVKRNLSWYVRAQEEMVDRMVANDQVHLARGGDALRAEWGADYQKNLNALQNLYNGARPVKSEDGGEVSMWDLVMSARTSDGRQLGNIPEVLGFYAGLSKDLNPYATIVPENGSDAAKTIDEEEAALNKEMADKTSSYWRGPQAAAKQARKLAIIELRLKMGDKNCRLIGWAATCAAHHPYCKRDRLILLVASSLDIGNPLRGPIERDAGEDRRFLIDHFGPSSPALR